MTYTGADGAELVAPLRSLGPVLPDSLRVMPYAESHTIHSDPDVPHAYYGDSAVLRDLDTGAAAELPVRAGPDAGTRCVVRVNHLGGAPARWPAPNAVPGSPTTARTAWGYPQPGGSWCGCSPWAAGTRPARWSARPSPCSPRCRPGGRRTSPSAPGTAASGGTRLYELYEPYEAVRAGDGAYEPETTKRLAGLKAAYGPANLLCGNY
ncbi:hypothetical protein ACFOOM_06030 [Streptomyces echinoruber]|uniref:hypothetical protein n=1 Tax=Streptomyces echinoruber TaxID=68898 RepID=UPI00167E1BA2|nr:hypothetical protein [Streptomyces echinoruber]